MMTYWNGPTAPEAVIVRSFGMYLYVPEVCPELLFVRVTLSTAGAAIVVMSARTASAEADGALAALLNATLMVLESKLCTP